MREKTKSLVVPLVVSAAAVIAVLSGLLASMDWRIYDLMLHARPAPVEERAVLLADIDDAAIAEIGTWPISRDVVADGLVALADLQALAISFDIEYVDPSPRGVDARYLEDDIPGYFNEGFGMLSDNTTKLFTALARRQIPLGEAESYVKDLSGLSDSLREDLLSRVRKIAADNDDRLGKAAWFQGSAYFTVNMRREPVPNQKPEILAAAAEKAGRALAKPRSGAYRVADGLLPTISQVLSRGAGAGFPNVYIDPDGVRRRIDLFYEFDGRLYSQLVLAPLLDIFGTSGVEAGKGYFLLKGSRLPSGQVADIRIPRAEDGRVLIDWPHKEYLSSFRHISLRQYIVHEKLFADLAHNLRIRDSWGYFSSYGGEESLAALAAKEEEYRRACLTGDDAPPRDAKVQLAAMRDALLGACSAFLATRPEAAIEAEISQLLADGKLDAATKEQYTTIQKDAPAYFAATRKLVEDLSSLRTRLRQETTGAFVIIGYTATGTTDIGVNPFAGEYVNVGTHAAVYNTIVRRSFIDDTPAWVPLLLGIAASFGLALIIRGRVPAVAIAIGSGTTAILALGILLVFVFGSRFVGPSVPILAAFLTFLSSTIVNFLKTEREKGFLRNAFSHYLSADVIKDIVADPSKLKLGGTKRCMTAMFTDIRGFSTVSEKMTPEDLVRLLNRYLTGMSDVILDLKGTIDKYEGDAIIAFFGAPIELPDHAYRCCQAAIKMKKIEEELNRQFLTDGTAPTPLLTRVGINTGDMVVGNMGTNRKMDYTIIGDAVNLAARLEGVNKQYGTWICASEDTVSAAGGDFFFRRLDRIRVVGKSQPIQIFELVDMKNALSQAQKSFFEGFVEAMARFDSRDWKGARETFQACLDASAEDGPSKTYIGRCDNYIKAPPPADWDGVYNLTAK